MRLEEVESWKGQQVVDSDDERIGKVEDVFFETTSREPRFLCVKSGLLGKRLSVVPLSGAAWSRDYVRVAFSKEQVKDGPQTDPGAELDPAAERELAAHYDLGEDDSSSGEGPRYESGSARDERLARAEEAEQRAAELERTADEKAAEAKEGAKSAAAQRDRASEAQREEEEARASAAQARAEARERNEPGSSR